MVKKKKAERKERWIEKVKVKKKERRERVVNWFWSK